MDVEEILRQLRFEDDVYPEDAMAEAEAHQEEITPFLLRALDRITAEPSLPDRYEEVYSLPYFALELLATFGEKKAYPKVMTLFSLPEENLYQLFDEEYVERDLPRVLLAIFDGDFTDLKAHIQNREIMGNVRAAFLKVYFVKKDAKESDKIAFLRSLIAAEKEEPSFEFTQQIMDTILYYQYDEMKDDVQEMFDKWMIDSEQTPDYATFIDQLYGTEYPRYFVITADEKEDGRDIPHEEWLGLKRRSEKLLYINELLKHGAQRNDPCPCGSGKKYKKCHLHYDQMAEKESSFQEPLRLIVAQLDSYPFVSDNWTEKGQMIAENFDREALAINKLVYLAIHERYQDLLGIEAAGNQVNPKQKRIMVTYLGEAHQLFLKKMAAEGLSSFEAYDKKYKLHYRSKDWHHILLKIMQELPDDYDQTKRDAVAEKLRVFSN